MPRTSVLRQPGDLREAPQHGNQGDRAARPVLDRPLGLTVAISRESGARGGSIARRVGRKLGWQVYSQELLEFLCGNESAREHLLADIPPEAGHWADVQLARLRSEHILRPEADLGILPRLMLTLAARGRAVLVGRGAGFLLPTETTLHCRIVAPLEDRIAYMTQRLRLTVAEAEAETRRRDERRSEFLVSSFRKRPNDFHVYDLVLNSHTLGEEPSAELIAMAVEARNTTSEPSEGFGDA